MVECPRCGNEVLDSSTEWEFADFPVKLFVCSKCKKTFKTYYRKRRLSHTIPKKSGQTFHSGSAHRALVKKKKEKELVIGKKGVTLFVKPSWLRQEAKNEQ
jgi:hypothetical protein